MPWYLGLVQAVAGNAQYFYSGYRLNSGGAGGFGNHPGISCITLINMAAPPSSSRAIATKTGMLYITSSWDWDVTPDGKTAFGGIAGAGETWVYGGTPICDGENHMVGYTYAADGSVQLYVDGKLDGQGAVPTVNTSGDSWVAPELGGTLDEFAHWNSRSLTAAEHAGAYDAWSDMGGLAEYILSLRPSAYYQFEETEGGYAANSANGGANDGNWQGGGNTDTPPLDKP